MRKISIITVCFNSEKYIQNTIESVLNQTYPNIEYIIVDGGSTDNTVNIIKSYGDKIKKFISEPDNGIYDAMNKGINLASGKIIGIINSDDFFSSKDIISKINSEFTDDFDAIYGDIAFVHPGNLKKHVRYYSGKNFRNWMLRFGIMPPHASVYIRKKVFDTFGNYKINFKVSADFELLVRFLYVNKIKVKYLNLNMVTMRTGGISTRSLSGKMQINKDSVNACKENGIFSNMLFMLIKYLFKFIFNC